LQHQDFDHFTNTFFLIKDPATKENRAPTNIPVASRPQESVHSPMDLDDPQVDVSLQADDPMDESVGEASQVRLNFFDLCNFYLE